MPLHSVYFRGPVVQDMARRVQAAQMRRFPGTRQIAVPGAASPPAADQCCKAIGKCPKGQICKVVVGKQGVGSECWCEEPPVVVANPRITGSRGDMARRAQATQMRRFRAVGVGDVRAQSCKELGRCPSGHYCRCHAGTGPPGTPPFCWCAVIHT